MCVFVVVVFRLIKTILVCLSACIQFVMNTVTWLKISCKLETCRSPWCIERNIRQQKVQHKRQTMTHFLKLPKICYQLLRSLTLNPPEHQVRRSPFLWKAVNVGSVQQPMHGLVYIDQSKLQTFSSSRPRYNFIQWLASELLLLSGKHQNGCELERNRGYVPKFETWLGQKATKSRPMRRNFDQA